MGMLTPLERGWVGLAFWILRIEVGLTWLFSHETLI
jgi:hypothetical protein